MVTADVRAEVDCGQGVEEAVARHGRLDRLVNSAGVIYRNRTVEQTTDEEWDTTFAVNVRGAFLMSRRALPALRATRGNIVHVASYAGLVGFAGAAAYAASKAALVNIARPMALDHAAEGIRVNCICPALVETELMQRIFEHTPDPAAARRAREAELPLGRLGKPEDVAALALYLASDESGWMTGAAIPLDGGLTAG